jgi:uncharacterized protein (TIGR03118 family)
LAVAPSIAAVSVSVTNLVTDDPTANAAPLTDAGLVNAWGISYSAAGPFWVSSNGAGTSTVYRVDPLSQATTKVALTVTIPGTGSVTGQVFNAAGTQFGSNAFLFVSEDGTVSGWRGALGTTAQSTANLSAIYKGAAIASVGGSSYLYAADFHNATVSVFKGTAAAPVLTGSFADPTLPSGYAPFNVQTFGSSLYVAYAKQDPNSPDEVAGVGLGLVNQFDLQGNFMARVAGGGALNAPWGLAIAPDTFGAWAGALLVGNFGDGRISAFDATTHAFLGQLNDAHGQPLSIDGLWGLSVGNGVGAGSTHALYFTAGPGDESHGLFGVMQAVPEPRSAALLTAGLLCIAWIGGRRREHGAES